MKRVKVTGGGIEVEVDLTWENILMADCKELGLKKGDSLGIHYRNHRSEYTYTPIPIYTHPYHPQESLDFLIAKNPNLKTWVEKFDLVLSV